MKHSRRGRRTARFKLLSTSPTCGANWRQAILIFVVRAEQTPRERLLQEKHGSRCRERPTISPGALDRYALEVAEASSKKTPRNRPPLSRPVRRLCVRHREDTKRERSTRDCPHIRGRPNQRENQQTRKTPAATCGRCVVCAGLGRIPSCHCRTHLNFPV